jgi:hypothetical protein
MLSNNREEISMTTIEAIGIPDTKLCKEITELVREPFQSDLYRSADWLALATYASKMYALRVPATGLFQALTGRHVARRDIIFSHAPFRT